MLYCLLRGLNSRPLVYFYNLRDQRSTTELRRLCGFVHSADDRSKDYYRFAAVDGV